MNKQTKTELAFAFSQMYETDLMRVPVEIQKEVLKDIDIEEFEKFDPKIPFTKQDFNTETLEILAAIFEETE